MPGRGCRACTRTRLTDNATPTTGSPTPSTRARDILQQALTTGFLGSNGSLPTNTLDYHTFWFWWTPFAPPTPTSTLPDYRLRLVRLVAHYLPDINSAIAYPSRLGRCCLLTWFPIVHPSCFDCAVYLHFLVTCYYLHTRMPTSQFCSSPPHPFTATTTCGFITACLRYSRGSRVCNATHPACLLPPSPAHRAHPPPGPCLGVPANRRPPLPTGTMPLYAFPGPTRFLQDAGRFYYSLQWCFPHTLHMACSPWT